RGRDPAILNARDGHPARGRIVRKKEVRAGLRDLSVFEVVNAIGSIREGSAAAIATHIAVVAPPCDRGNHDALSETQANPRFRIAVDEVRDPTVGIAIESVVDVGDEVSIQSGLRAADG